MHTIARNILNTYLQEKRVLTLPELGIDPLDPQYLQPKIVFVTLYRGGKVIASSGRIHPKQTSYMLELIENTLALLRDPRASTVSSPAEIKTLSFRVDMIDPVKDRRLVRSLTDVNVALDGLILLHQKLEKISVLLPGIVNMTTSAEELFSILCKKVDLDPKKLDPTEYHLYAIRSKMSADIA